MALINPAKWLSPLLCLWSQCSRRHHSKWPTPTTFQLTQGSTLPNGNYGTVTLTLVELVRSKWMSP